MGREVRKVRKGGRSVHRSARAPWYPSRGQRITLLRTPWFIWSISDFAGFTIVMVIAALLIAAAIAL